MDKPNFFNTLSDFIQTIVIGIKLIFSTLYFLILKPISRGSKKVWEKFWDKLIYLKPYWIFSFFYIAFAVLMPYLELIPSNSSAQISSLGIMANLLSVQKEWIVAIFAISAWFISNIRRPIVYVGASIPLFIYAYSVIWGVMEGLVIVRGLLAALAYLAVGLFAIVTIRQEIQNAIHQYEIKKLKSKIENMSKDG